MELVNKKARCPECKHFELRKFQGIFLMTNNKGEAEAIDYFCQNCGAKFVDIEDKQPTSQD